MSLENLEVSRKLYVRKMPRSNEIPYVMINSVNLIQSKKLSLPEKGILTVINSLDSTKPITISRVSKVCKEHKDTVRSYMEKLEKLGFVAKKDLVAKPGLLPEYHYVIDESACMKLSDKKISYKEGVKSKKVSYRKSSYDLNSKEESNNINNKIPPTPQNEKVVREEEKVLNFSEQQEKNKLVSELNSHGVNISRKLVFEEFPTDPERIKRQLKYFPFREFREAGILVNNIREDAPAPTEFLKNEKAFEQKQLKQKWDLVLKTVGIQPGKTIQYRLSDLVYNIVSPLTKIHGYKHASIEFKSDENNQKTCKIAIQEFRKILNVISLQEALNLVNEYLSDQSLKDLCPGLRKMKIDNISQVLARLQVIPGAIEELELML